MRKNFPHVHSHVARASLRLCVYPREAGRVWGSTYEVISFPSSTSKPSNFRFPLGPCFLLIHRVSVDPT